MTMQNLFIEQKIFKALFGNKNMSTFTLEVWSEAEWYFTPMYTR